MINNNWLCSLINNAINSFFPGPVYRRSKGGGENSQTLPQPGLQGKKKLRKSPSFSSTFLLFLNPKISGEKGKRRQPHFDSFQFHSLHLSSAQLVPKVSHWNIFLPRFWRPARVWWSTWDSEARWTRRLCLTLPRISFKSRTKRLMPCSACRIFIDL